MVFWKVLFIQRLQLAELEEIKQRKEGLKYLQLHQIDFKMCCGRTIFNLKLKIYNQDVGFANLARQLLKFSNNSF